MNIAAKLKDNPKLGLIILSYISFIALGMPDGLLGIAWPSMRAYFSMPLDAVGMLLAGLVSGYLISSFLSGQLITRSSVGIILAASCIMTGIALICYTIAPAWWVMILISVIAGLGAGAIDAGLNTYVAANFSEGLMQWMHACYGIGVTIGPVLMAFSLNSFNTWKMGYLVVGGFQLVLGASFALTLKQWKVHEHNDTNRTVNHLADYRTPLVESIKQPKVWLSAFLFFIYVGSEVALGTFAYTFLIESRGIQHESAAFWAGSYWATFAAGRILAGIYIKHIGSNILIFLSLIAAIISSALLWWNPTGLTNLISIAMIGFAIAPIFPAMMSATKLRVGMRNTANTIGMQMSMGSLGAAIIPGAVGILARNISLEIIPLCLIVLFCGLLCLYLLSLKWKLNE